MATITRDREMEIAAWRDQLESRALGLIGAAACVAAYWNLYTERNVFSPQFLLLVAVASLLLWFRQTKQLGFFMCAAFHYLLLPVALGALLYFAGQPWLAFAAAPLVLVAALTRPGSEVAMISAVAVALLALPNGVAEAGIFFPALFTLTVTTLLALTLRRSISRTFGWYALAASEARTALDSTRAHRAQLAAALKTERIALSIQERARLEILRAKEQADEAKRMKEQFAANISHELRTPLNIILGFSELMHTAPHIYSDDPFPAKLRRDVSHIYFSCKHLVDLIDDILDLSRFESSEFQLIRTPTTIEEIINGMMDTAAEIFQGSSVKLQVRELHNLPEILVDSGRIQQVLLNLLTNARRHTSQGSVTISAREEADYVVTSVQDTGRGIPSDELERIFEEFYQVDRSMSRSYQGAGLGLAICRRLVEAHGGRIWAEASVGEGALFHVAIPKRARIPRFAGQNSSEAVQVLPPSPLESEPSLLLIPIRHLPRCLKRRWRQHRLCKSMERENYRSYTEPRRCGQLSRTRFQGTKNCN